jgi:hypothetical protein
LGYRPGLQSAQVILPPDEIERTADRYLTSGHVLHLRPTQLTPEPIYTTRNLYELPSAQPVFQPFGPPPGTGWSMKLEFQSDSKNG